MKELEQRIKDRIALAQNCLDNNSNLEAKAYFRGMIDALEWLLKSE